MKYRKWSEAVLIRGLCAGHPTITTYYYYYLRQRAGRVLSGYGSVRVGEVLSSCYSKAFLVLVEKLRQDKCRSGKLDAFALGIVKLTFREAVYRRKQEQLPPGVRQRISDGWYGPSVDALSCGAVFDRHGHDQLLQWYDQLPDRDRRVLDLQLEGYSHKDSASLLGLQYGTVRNIYSRLIQEAREIG